MDAFQAKRIRLAAELLVPLLGRIPNFKKDWIRRSKGNSLLTPGQKQGGKPAATTGQCLRLLKATQAQKNQSRTQESTQNHKPVWQAQKNQFQTGESQHNKIKCGVILARPRESICNSYQVVETTHCRSGEPTAGSSKHRVDGPQ